MCTNHIDTNTCGCHCGCHSHASNRMHEHGHDHGVNEEKGLKAFIAPGISSLMLIAGVIASHFGAWGFIQSPLPEAAWYLLAFLPVGLPVMAEAWEGIQRRDVFNEFTLMTIACIGAFCIGEYPEAVGVMLFYSIGESLQDRAVAGARRNISRLLDIRPEKARVVKKGITIETDPKEVAAGDCIEVRPGERVPLDGTLRDSTGIFDTSALTGESVPRVVETGGEVLAGMISTGNTVKITVEKPYGQSTISRILELVENAAAGKARTELFIRRFARVYTPIVLSLAFLLVFIPWIIGMASPGFYFVFSHWLSRALVFLVISCPCALVISVPLAYFAGIGAASKAGILFKGGNYLEAIRKVKTVAFDKTGTLTTGHFHAESIHPTGMPETEFLRMLASAEMQSSHPLAMAIVDFAKQKGLDIPVPSEMKEVAGYGVSVIADGKKVVAGNIKHLEREGIEVPSDIASVSHDDGSIIFCAIGGRPAGYVVMADTLKEDAAETVTDLRALGIDRIVMLSGDRKEIVARYSAKLGIREAHGELLPQDKAAFIEKIVAQRQGNLAFVGDGMNDAPVLALSDVGVAMGGLGSDAAIESADIVIQSDSPSKLSEAIRIGRKTHTIVTENIAGAIGIKGAILILGAFGIATMWAAVFADVGVALLAVLNSMRIMRRGQK